MKRFLVAVILALAVVAPASAGEEASKDSKDSSLVDAAKKNKTSRKKSTKKVITNSDVKKSKGTLIVVDRPAPPPVATSSIGPISQYEIDRKARRDAEERVAAETKRVTDLEKDLARIEQSYYDENDPNYRDNVIQKRFDQTRLQLESARQDLADARGSLERLSTPRQP